ncbi:MAG: hypothetical protein EPO28_10460 [Saprospiraceae bacterium]|nr:MAG: hypothetical protein EPO28_10460 [Saprospiraceae bacterium]
MRIIGTIEHPALKITAFKTEDRLSVKFEFGLMEQVFKFREREGLRDFDDVSRMVDKPMLDAVAEIFKTMLHAREQACLRLIPPEEANEFEVII